METKSVRVVGGGDTMEFLDWNFDHGDYCRVCYIYICSVPTRTFYSFLTVKYAFAQQN